MFRNRSISVLIGAVLGTAYMIYIINNYINILNNPGSVGEALAAIFASVFIIPHIILLALAVLVNWISFFSNGRGLAITAGILYLFSGILMFIYFFFILPSSLLSFIGASNIKKINAAENTG